MGKVVINSAQLDVKPQPVISLMVVVNVHLAILETAVMHHVHQTVRTELVIRAQEFVCLASEDITVMFVTRRVT